MEPKTFSKKEVLQISINTLGNMMIPAVLSETMGKDILGVMGNLQKVIGMIEAEENAAAAAKEGGDAIGMIEAEESAAAAAKEGGTDGTEAHL